MSAEREIVVVSDPTSLKRTYSVKENTTEGYPAKLICEIVEALHVLAPRVTVIDDIREFVIGIENLSNAVVIPCYFGPASRTSKVLVPAICEAAGVPYIGADAYVQALCNDKYFSRLYASDFGLSVSSAILVNNAEDIDATTFRRLRFPVVVKPNLGGGSNGIDSTNLCDSAKTAAALCRQLQQYQSIPLIVESYASGREVQVVFADLPDGNVLTAQIGIELNGKDYFDHELFDLSIKKKGEGRVSFSSVNCVRENDLAAMRRIYDSLGKVGFMRMDCRVSRDGRAILLELSPDCSLSPRSGMFYAFRQAGLTYPEMFRTFIEAVQ